MKVCIYSSCLKLVKKSGVGQAIFHQMKMLKSAGVEVTYKDTLDTDVIHINTVFPDSFLKSVTAHWKGKKVICYGHSTMEDFKYSFKGSNALAPLFRWWIKRCYTNGDVIITPTEYSRKLLLGYGIKKPIFVISNGIDTDLFQFSKQRRKRFREKYRISENEKAVMSVGHYIERKGILDFILLARKNPDYRFFWFGYTNLNLVPEKIRKAIENAPDNLAFPGYVENERLCDAYCGCDLFQFMSFEETEGIVVLEALACKISVIVRDIPVYNGWLIDKVNVYKASDNESFQLIMNRVFSGSLPDLHEAGRKVTEQRCFNQMGKELLAVYEKIAVPNNVPAFCIKE